MSANKTNIKESNEEEKVAINLKQNNSKILPKQNDVESIKQKLKENLDSNLKAKSVLKTFSI